MSLDILKLYRGGGRGGEHNIQGFEEDNLPGDMMSGAEQTKIPNLGHGRENQLVSRTDSGEGEGLRVENPNAPAVEGGPLEQDMENLIIRTQPDQYTENKVIGEDKENMDMEEEGEGRGENPLPVDLPSREEERREPSPEYSHYGGENEVEIERAT